MGEERSEKEKEEVRNKKRELFEEQKKKMKDIQIIQIQMKRVEEYECWENSKKQEVNFIRTKENSQMIYWLPKIHNEKSEALLQESKEAVEKEIDERKEQFEEELVSIEKRMTADLEKMQERRRLAAIQRNGGVVNEEVSKLDDSVEGEDSFVGDRKVVERDEGEDEEDGAVRDLRVSLSNGEKRVVRTEEERVVRRDSDVEDDDDERRVVVKNEEEVEEQKRARQMEEERKLLKDEERRKEEKKREDTERDTKRSRKSSGRVRGNEENERDKADANKDAFKERTRKDEVAEIKKEKSKESDLHRKIEDKLNRQEGLKKQSEDSRLEKC